MSLTSPEPRESIPGCFTVSEAARCGKVGCLSEVLRRCRSTDNRRRQTRLRERQHLHLVVMRLLLSVAETGSLACVLWSAQGPARGLNPSFGRQVLPRAGEWCLVRCPLTAARQLANLPLGFVFERPTHESAKQSDVAGTLVSLGHWRCQAPQFSEWKV